MNRRKGFTLIELLVVVAIITLLIAILLPSLNRAVLIAEKATCMSNMRQIGIAFRSYQAEHSGYSHNAPNHGHWKNITGDPLADPDEPWIDPNDGLAYWGVIYGQYMDYQIRTFRCPSAGDVDDWWHNDQPRYQYSTYGLNKLVSNTSLTAVNHASDRILFQDAAEQLMDDNGDNWSITPSHGINLYQWRVTWIGTWPQGWREYFRHMNYGNALYYDLHAGDHQETTGEDVPRRWYTGSDD